LWWWLIRYNIFFFFILLFFIFLFFLFSRNRFVGAAHAVTRPRNHFQWRARYPLLKIAFLAARNRGEYRTRL
jgi:hypothetical protein